MIPESSQLSPLDRLLHLFTKVRPGEGKCTLLFFIVGFIFMFSQWMLKAVREAFLLGPAPPEMASYAQAVTAVVLMAMIPFYSVLFKRQEKIRLVQTIILFFVVCLVLFYTFGERGLFFGFTFYVWVGIFSVVMIVQFWAFAADQFNIRSGQRLFAVLAAGVSLGGWLGSASVSSGIEQFGDWGMLPVVAAILLLPLLLIRPSARSIPEGSRATGVVEEAEQKTNYLGGFHLVYKDTYLRIIAAYVVLQNLIDTTGDYILRVWIVRRAQELIASGESVLEQGAQIGVIYGNFNAWMNLLTLLLALFAVSRVIRYVGMRVAMIIMPIVMIIGYGVIAFIPVFTVIRVVKLAEKSGNYSLNNTLRGAMFLPTSDAAKYEGKTTIDAFFWRFGDLLSAGVVFLGVSWLDLPVQYFAALNIVVAIGFLFLARVIGGYYKRLAATNVTNEPPRVVRSIPTAEVTAGMAFEHPIHPGTFEDPDPGEVLVLSATLADGAPLPSWVNFDLTRLRFHGTVPTEFMEEIVVQVTASDVDGATVSDTFIIRHIRQTGHAD